MENGGQVIEHVVVAGLGYVGLPVALAATASGLRVTGLDSNDNVVSALRAGRSHVDDFSDADIAVALRAGFRVTSDPDVLAKADVIVICVPTPLSEEGSPDLSAVRAVGAAVSSRLRTGALVVLESTTWPGTTEEFLKPLLEISGLRAGEDFHLAFSPERIDPGNPHYGLRNTPKVVGGFSDACTKRAADFYGYFINDIVFASGTREAEMSKLLENTYRHINIALVNEMARFSHELGINFWNVIDCAASKPFGFQSFRPGPGVGGHCIPIDPNYLSHQVRTRLGYPFRFVELAEEINAAMPLYVADRIRDLLNDNEKSIRNARILLLGVTYKPNVTDVRETPALPLAIRLQKWGADVRFHDPGVSTWRVGASNLMCEPDLGEALQDADVAVLLQTHMQYDLQEISQSAKLLLDTRGAAPAPAVPL